MKNYRTKVGDANKEQGKKGNKEGKEIRKQRQN
jgi:hypothetical protein